MVFLQEESSHGGRSDLSTSCCSSIESSAEQDRGQGYSKVSSCTPLICSPRVHFPSLRSYEQDSSSDSLCSPGDCTLPLAGLRGNVSQGDSCYAGPFFKDVEREAREEEDELSMPDSPHNEGIIFYNDVLASWLLRSSFCLKCASANLTCLPLFIIEPSGCGLRIQRRQGICSLWVYQWRLLWWSIQSSRYKHRIQLCCQKGIAGHLILSVFPLLHSSEVWLLCWFTRRLHWRSSAVRRWVRGVPSDLPVWWNSLEWSERGLMFIF